MSYARFMHSPLTPCQVHGCASFGEPGELPQDAIRRQAAPIAPPLKNPTGRGTDWYHGTHHDDPDDEYADEGGTVRPPSETGHGDNDMDGRRDEHWNTDLGSHFTSLPHVAQEFANGRFAQPEHARVLTAGLHMGNPKHFDSEEEMADHAIDWAHKNGHQWLQGADAQKRRRFAQGDYGFSARPGDEDDEHLGEHMDRYHDHIGGFEHEINDIDAHGSKARATDSTKQTWLAQHPERERVTAGYVDHLKSLGHDGITYGNSIEGPKGHTCAIAFDDTPIHHRKWTWTDSEQEAKHHGPRSQHTEDHQIPGQAQMRIRTAPEGHHYLEAKKQRGTDSAGHPVELDDLDGWQHLDGSIGEEDGTSVTDRPVQRVAFYEGPWQTHIHGDRGEWLARTEEDHKAHLHAQRLDAERATNGNMVSAAGKARGITGEDFFKPGTRRSIEQWGSDEMKRWHGSENTAQVGEKSQLGHVFGLSEYRRHIMDQEKDAYHRYADEHGEPEETGWDEADQAKWASKWGAATKTAGAVIVNDSNAMAKIGRSEHPNVDHYASGGIGHQEGDDTHSVVGFMPTRLIHHYREHNAGDDWNGDTSREAVDKIRQDIRSGKGIHTPLMVEYDPVAKWGHLGEGNHRLAAARAEGLQTVPVRVSRSYRGAGAQRRGVGARMQPDGPFVEHDPDYVPSDIHPHRMMWDDPAHDEGSIEHTAAVVPTVAYHATTMKDWPPTHGWHHVGTPEAALQRGVNVDHPASHDEGRSGAPGGSRMYVHEVELHGRTYPHTLDDESVNALGDTYADNDEMSAEDRRRWNMPTIHEIHDKDDLHELGAPEPFKGYHIIPYRNDKEDAGSTSYLVHHSAIKVRRTHDLGPTSYAKQAVRAQASKIATVLTDWRPTERLFAPTKGTVDPILFGEDEHMLPEVREEILAATDEFFDEHGYGDPDGWARVYLAGSQASEWYGNRDFDILIGVNYDKLRKAHPQFDGMTVQEIDAQFNTQLRDDFNQPGWHPAFDPTQTWDRTGYVNPNSWNIADIKPYAAYNVTDDEWAVKPIHEPEGHRFEQSEIYYFEGVAAQARNALSLAEPLRTRRCSQIWEFVHSDRSRAFGPHGTGAFDRGNALEKYLDQAPSPYSGVSLMQALANVRYGKEQKTAAAQPDASLYPKHPLYQPGDRVTSGGGFAGTVHHTEEPDGAGEHHRVWIEEDDRPGRTVGIHPNHLQLHPDASEESKAHHARQVAKNESGEPYVPQAERNMDENDRVTVHHLTGDPHFKPSTTHRPENNTTMGGDLSPRLFVGDAHTWAEGQYGYKRPYVAEMSVPRAAVHSGGGYSGEGEIHARNFDKVHVKRVIPYDVVNREQYGVHGPTESYHGTTFDTGEKITPEQQKNNDYGRRNFPAGYKWSGDTRDWSPQQHQEHVTRHNQYLKGAHGWDIGDDHDWGTHHEAVLRRHAKTAVGQDFERAYQRPFSPMGEVGADSQLSVGHIFKHPEIDKHPGEYNITMNHNPTVARVRPGVLRPTQPHLDEAYLHRGDDPDRAEHDKMPGVIKDERGRYRLVDGHHRAARALLNGDSHIDVRLWDVKKVFPHLNKKTATIVPRGADYAAWLRHTAMPWHNRNDGVDPSHAKSVRHAGYAGYVGDSEMDEELGHHDHDEFDEDLWDHTTPEPTHEEEQHNEEHGEYPDSHHERHEQAYQEAMDKKQQEDEPDHDDPELHEFIGEHGDNSKLWHEKATLGKVSLTGPVYATQSHVNQEHIDHYRADPGSDSHTMRSNESYRRVREEHPYLADKHPMFVTHQGRLHVTDGHHRVAAALQDGKKSIVGWHYDGDKHGLPGYEDDDDDYHTASRRTGAAASEYFSGGVDDLLEAPFEQVPHQKIRLDEQHWKSLPVQDVPREGLKRTQKSIFKKHLTRNNKTENGGNDDLPWVIHHGGEHWVIDGHHRAVNAMQRGDSTFKAHVMQSPFDDHEKVSLRTALLRVAEEYRMHGHTTDEGTAWVGKHGMSYAQFIREAGAAKPLPTANGTYYRLHAPDRDFSRADASTKNNGEAPNPGMEKYWQPKEGYSAFWSPHHLHQYLNEMGWDSGAKGSKVIRFQGTPVGEGADGEPRVMPHNDKPDESMSVSQFRKRLDITPHHSPGKHYSDFTWGEGPEGRIVDDGYRSLLGSRKAYTKFMRQARQDASQDAPAPSAPGKYPEIHPEHLSTSDGRRSRSVSAEEFQQIAHRGHQRYQELSNSKGGGTQGLDKHFDKLIDHAYRETRKPWGGMTVNAKTGHHLPEKTDKDLYALTAREPGMEKVSVPEDASKEDFTAAMHHARDVYGHVLARKQHHFGVFHDNDKGTVDIDPVFVTPHHHEVEEVGAYTHAVGGAYNFKDGDGYWPPHVASTAKHTGATMGPSDTAERPRHSTLMRAMQARRARAEQQEITVAGLGVIAENTGRILLIQRSNSDQSDPAKGLWEMPGGHLDPGETPLDAAEREWTEETGAPLPTGHVVGSWVSNGMYKGFWYLVPSEDSVDINQQEGRALNPDDPDGDDIEVCAFWEPSHLLKSNRTLRPEFIEGLDRPVLNRVLREYTDNGDEGVTKQADRHAEFHDPEWDTPEPEYGWNPIHGAKNLYGKGSWRAMFGDNPTTVTPWPSHRYGPAVRDKIRPEIDKVVSNPHPHIQEVDPRILHSSQPGISRAGVAYYLHSPEYRQQGKTFADGDQAGNQVPVVLRRADGRHVILSGHHRAAAALLRGEPLHAAIVHEPPDDQEHS